MAELVRAEGVPIYVQIREALREDITGGGLKRGEKLPAEHELALKFGVSRMTIRESIEDLVDEEVRSQVGDDGHVPHDHHWASVVFHVQTVMRTSDEQEPCHGQTCDTQWIRPQDAIVARPLKRHRAPPA